MLALAEPYLTAISQARTDGDFVEIAGRLARDFGFRSAFLVEYGERHLAVVHVLDTDPRRLDWWKDYLSSGLRQSTSYIQDFMGRASIQKLNLDRFTDPNDPLLGYARRMDLVDFTMLPVSHSNQIVGVAGFCGEVDLDDRQKSALQMVVYTLFAHVRRDRRMGIVTAPEPLTPREKEVIALSAEGLTSVEIAERLGLSARTVNQHVDNVAEKLGTKNRAHTVAEAVRHRMF
ncbi:helix-turn-helix transcriptional regulator [Devosia sp. Leaf64]|uniref:helix-turn-helix domain-containing protein n=1 Tax=Devosia sp. Leaf64 TaxID=1736229 RepID=UPI0007126E43|nr:helix-turn-helix transcriptional regulator [Devosia sp. Leaf64]KQN74427.1 hypothetical protein ASE94_20160 [Devosia sp. Leaf64]